MRLLGWVARIIVDKPLNGEASLLGACVAARNPSAFKWLAFCQSFRVEHACIIPYFSHFSPRTTADFISLNGKKSVYWKPLIGSLQHSSAANLGVLPQAVGRARIFGNPSPVV